MRGTIVCGVSDSEGGRNALRLAADLSERFGARLVLMHVAAGVGAVGGEEGLTAAYGRQGAERLLAGLVAEFGLDASQRRWAVGDRVGLLATMAAEEAADLIVVGSRPGRLIRRGLRSSLATKLGTQTPIPVLVAPPRARHLDDDGDTRPTTSDRG
jgi:nucleotide-binding universal stress UspA family protein